jgi:hypothetical protein
MEFPQDLGQKRGKHTWKDMAKIDQSGMNEQKL